ncbi:hypothetical protein GNI_182660 [Gregarina niphandrodes]|uniref:Uncharacterized protein n=1 Tax=Gregarina niphandrodes TaxID=110365 RepID=A0A023AWT2_GRENI|nr:hypothetical protein GNI_182660 [Gregarina niphandrodes]EZG43206.1 hypothetical protein GNI_182660 [Gregarina niphandrodes]|eukprot:XP_011133537.1 hypothetical protein GNI_182660 [Gregarina niphandrodes]
MRGSAASEALAESLALFLAHRVIDCGLTPCPTLDEPCGFSWEYCTPEHTRDEQVNTFQLRLDQPWSHHLFLTVATQALERARLQPLVAKEQIYFDRTAIVNAWIDSPDNLQPLAVNLLTANPLLSETLIASIQLPPAEAALSQSALLDLARACGVYEQPEAQPCIRALKEPVAGPEELLRRVFRVYLERYDPDNLADAEQILLKATKHAPYHKQYWEGLCRPLLDVHGGRVVFTPPAIDACDQCRAPPPSSFGTFRGHLQPAGDRGCWETEIAAAGCWEAEAAAAAAAVQAAAAEQGVETAQLPWAATWKPWAEYAGVFGGLLKTEWKNVVEPQAMVCSAVDKRVYQRRVISLRRLLANCRLSRSVVRMLEKDMEAHRKRATQIARNQGTSHTSKQGDGWYVGSIDQVYLTLEFNPELPADFNLDSNPLPSGTKTKINTLLTPVCLKATSEKEAQEKQDAFFLALEFAPHQLCT